MADIKFSQFAVGGDMQVGDIVVGLRAGTNYQFSFPDIGFQDSSGNFLLQYASVGAAAVNYPLLINSATTQEITYTAGGPDSNIDIALLAVGTGHLILNTLTWPNNDGLSGQVLTTDGSGNLEWSTVSTVVLPTTDQAIARFNGTGGALENSGVLLDGSNNISNVSTLVFAGATSGTAVLEATAISGSAALTLPAATDTLVGRSTTDTLINKSISGSSNTLTNIAVASLAAGTAGDLITWDAGGNPDILSVGSAGLVLTSNGAGNEPTWQASSGGGDMFLAAVQTVTGAKTFDSGTLIYAGSSSGTITLNAPASAGTNTLTLPAATDTLVGRATTDTLTNKSISGATNTFSAIPVSALAVGTAGDVITWDASGNPLILGIGTVNYVLTSNGSGASPTWQATGAGDMVLAAVQTVTGAKTFNSGKLIIAGSSSGTIILNAPASAGSNTITVPAATDTLVARNTTDTLTNKSISGASNTLSAIPVSALAVGTAGDVITWDGSGNPAILGIGTSGFVLTSQGAGSEPTWAAGGSGDMLLAGVQTVTGAKTFNSGKMIYAGSSSGTITLNAQAIAGTNTLILPAASDTLVARNTTDTLTNKTISGASNTLSHIAVASLATGTPGDLVTWDSGGNPFILGAGTVGQVLATQGAVDVPVWTTAGVGDMVLAGVQTVTGAKTFNNNTLLVAGSSSGVLTIDAPAAAGTHTVTLPAATDTLVGKATTDTLTNKSISGASNTLSAIPVSALATGTAGDLITWDASNNPLILGIGTSGYVLTSGGAGSAPSWTAAAAGDMILSAIQTVTGAKTFNSGKMIYAGSGSGTTILNASAAAGSTTLTLPAATDTLVARATTDTLTNKSISGATNTLSAIAVTSLAAGTAGDLITWSSGGTATILGISTSGFVLTSQGAGAAPVWAAAAAGDMILSAIQTVTGAKTFNSGKMIYAGSSTGTTILNASAAAGSTTLVLPAANDTLVGKATTDTLTNKTMSGASNTFSAIPYTALATSTAGYLFTWDASGNPGQIATGTTGQVLTSQGASAVAVWASAAGLSWANISGTTQNAAVNTGYVIGNASQTTVTLPVTAALGSIVEVAGNGAGGWILAANTGQTIKIGGSTTSSAGSLTSAAAGDTIRVVAIVANTTWRVLGTVSSGLTIA